jgi:hypothetical protein
LPQLRVPRPPPRPVRGLELAGHHPGTGLAKSAKITMPLRVRAGLLRRSLRFLTWICVGLLGLLSLLPAEDMVRTGLTGPLEHFAAYAGSGAIAMAGYGLRRSGHWVLFGVTPGYLTTLQHFSPGGTRQLWISQHRSLEPCAAGSPSSSSRAGGRLQ